VCLLDAMTDHFPIKRAEIEPDTVLFLKERIVAQLLGEPK
jgi:hypothetical protein